MSEHEAVKPSMEEVLLRLNAEYPVILVTGPRQEISVWVKVDPDTVKEEDNFTRNVSNIGHYGTGDLEILIKNDEDLERAKPLIVRSYEGV